MPDLSHCHRNQTRLSIVTRYSLTLHCTINTLCVEFHRTMDLATRCLWLLVVIAGLLGVVLGDCKEGYNCVGITQEQNDECQQSNCNDILLSKTCKCELNSTSYITTTPKPELYNSNIFDEVSCDNLLILFDNGCNDITLNYTKIGILVQLKCCGIKGTLKTPPCSSSSSPSPSPFPYPSSTSFSSGGPNGNSNGNNNGNNGNANGNGNNNGNTPYDQTGDDSNPWDNNQGGQAQRPPGHIRVMDPHETLIMALCGMGGVAIIAGFLYYVPIIGIEGAVEERELENDNDNDNDNDNEDYGDRDVMEFASNEHV